MEETSFDVLSHTKPQPRSPSRPPVGGRIEVQP